MAATRNEPLVQESGDRNEIPVAATKQLFQGSMSFADVAGRATDVLGTRFLGHLAAEADNRTGGAGAINALLHTGRYRAQVTLAAVALTSQGAPVYASDNDTLSLSDDGGANTWVGYVQRYVAANTAVVEFHTNPALGVVPDDGSVTAAKLGAKAVETAAIDDKAVDTGQIADGAVEALQLGVKAVETAAIDDKAVDTGQIADGAVEALQLGAKAVETAKINDKAVDTGQIADGAVEALQVEAALLAAVLGGRTLTYWVPSWTADGAFHNVVHPKVELPYGAEVVAAFASVATQNGVGETLQVKLNGTQVADLSGAVSTAEDKALAVAVAADTDWQLSVLESAGGSGAGLAVTLVYEITLA